MLTTLGKNGGTHIGRAFDSTHQHQFTYVLRTHTKATFQKVIKITP